MVNKSLFLSTRKFPHDNFYLMQTKSFSENQIKSNSQSYGILLAPQKAELRYPINLL